MLNQCARPQLTIAQTSVLSCRFLASLGCERSIRNVYNSDEEMEWEIYMTTFISIIKRAHMLG
jgi:hypothetical protein